MNPVSRLDIQLAVADEVAALYQTIPEVAAIALAGSSMSGTVDDRSDIDLYVYGSKAVPIAARAVVATGRAPDAEVDNRFWELGDEWVESSSDLAVDVTFRDIAWVDGELDRVLRRHEASVGYSTCIWANIRLSRALFDRDGRFAILQAAALQPYPDPLR